MDKLEETLRLAESYALKAKDFGNGHIRLEGHGALVNYWPLSKGKTAHVKNGPVVKHCSPWDAVRLCLTNGKGSLTPKKVTKNAANIKLKPITTNPAKIKHLYKGKTPPWEFPSLIMCHSDDLRLQAYQLVREAEQNDSYG